MKSAEVPKGALIAIAAVAVLVLGFFAFSNFVKAPPQVDPAQVPAERLLDPDHRGPSKP